MKGQISIIEAVSASIVLLVAFNILITSQTYQNKWGDAALAVNGRDILATSDRLGRLYTYSFSQSTFATEMLSNLNSVKDYIVKLDTQGIIKSSTYIACNCTQDQITYVQNALVNVKVNNRLADVSVCVTGLDKINPCTSTQQYPDILIVWGYRDMSSNLPTLLDLTNNSVSILEIADLTPSQLDVVQQRIFGLKFLNTGNFPGNPDAFLKPANATVLPYQAYKMFYHVPYLLKSTFTGSIPVEGGIPICTSTATAGTFRFNNVNHNYWVCGASSVYLDTNGNNVADKVVIPGNTFSIGSFNFKLNYIDDTSTIRISFKPDYTFVDFASPDNSHNKLFPADDDKNKVLLDSGFWDVNQQQPVSIAIFNGSESVKVAWVADFSRSGLPNTGDDHKQLLASLVLSMSNKEVKQILSQGQISSYINALNTDMFEVYRINLKFIKPF